MKNMPPKLEQIKAPIVDSDRQSDLSDAYKETLADNIGKSAFTAAQILFGKTNTIPGSFFALSEDGIPYKIESDGAGSLREINLTTDNHDSLGGLGGTVISEEEAKKLAL